MSGPNIFLFSLASNNTDHMAEFLLDRAVIQPIYIWVEVCNGNRKKVEICEEYKASYPE